MTAAAATAPAPAKGGKLKKLLVPLLAVLILGGGAAAGGYWFGTTSTEGHAVDPNEPQLVPRGEGAGEEKAAKGEHGKAAKPAESAPAPSGVVDRSRFQATYYTIETPFTSNLKDSDAFIQVSLAVATYYDSRVTDALKTHEMAVRSAVLMTLAEQEEIGLTDMAGKEALQRKLTDTINNVLRDRTGFGGIDNVYFTSFVVQ